jgi:hypothetical protein
VQPLEILGVQLPTRDRPVLMLRDGGQNAYAVGLAHHQLLAIEAATCACAKQEPAAATLLEALGRRLLAGFIAIEEGELPTTWLLIEGDDASTTLPVRVDHIEVLTLVMRAGLPLYLAGEIDAAVREWQQRRAAESDLAAKQDVPSAFRPFLDALPLEDL